MKVHCFYERWNLKDAPVVELWTRLWLEQGWEPITLTLADAKPHPLFEAVSKCADEFPTVNNRHYEKLCFQRWCAYAKVGGLCVDYDVLPLKPFPPQTWPGFINGSKFIDPGFVCGEIEHYESFLRRIVAHKPANGHVSDQTVIKDNADLFTETLPLVQCYHSPDWETFPLVHFANGLMDYPYEEKSRIDQICSILKL